MKVDVFEGHDGGQDAKGEAILEQYERKLSNAGDRDAKIPEVRNV